MVEPLDSNRWQPAGVELYRTCQPSDSSPTGSPRQWPGESPPLRPARRPLRALGRLLSFPAHRQPPARTAGAGGRARGAGGADALGDHARAQAPLALATLARAAGARLALGGGAVPALRLGRAAPA